VDFLGCEASIDVDRSLLTKNFAYVDLPEDLGPHTMTTRGVCPDGIVHLASISFHSGGEIKGWRYTFGGPSFDEKSCLTFSCVEHGVGFSSTYNLVGASLRLLQQLCIF